MTQHLGMVGMGVTDTPVEPVTPATIFGEDLLAWYDNTVLESLNLVNVEGTFHCNSMEDLSGNGFTMDWGSLSGGPVHGTHAMNGEDVLHFANSRLSCESLIVSQPHTLFFIHKLDGDELSSTQAAFDGISDTGRALFATRVSGDDYLMGAGVNLTSSTSRNTNYNYFTCLYNGSSSYMRMNGVDVSVGSDVGTQNISDGLLLGARNDGQLRFYGNLPILCVVQGVQSTEDIEAMETYLANRITTPEE